MFQFKKEQQIYQFIRYAPIFLILFLSISFTYYLYIEKQNNLKYEIKNIEKFYYKEHREFVKNKVNEVYEKINYYSSKKDFDDEVKEYLLEEIARIKYEHGNGYIFITDYEGNMLVHIDNEIVGKNKLDWKDENGFEIIKEIINSAKNGGGYLSYGGVKKPTTNLVSFKTTFVKGFDKLNWAIGAGFYNDDLNNIIESRKKEIEEKFKEDIKNIFIFIICFTIILIYLAIVISDAMKEKFEEYKTEIEEEIDKNRKKNIMLEKEINHRNEYEKVINATCLVSISDIKGRIVYANKEFCEISGYKESELIGKNHKILKHPQMSKEFYENLWSTILSGRIWKGIHKNLTKDGKTIYLNTTIAPLKNHKGQIIRFIATRFDVTEQMKMQEELKEKENILIHQSKMASMGEMIGAIAHQWRQPLSLISTTATGIKIQNEYGILDKSQLEESMDSINNSIQHLSNTIDDFRNFFIPNKEKKSFDAKNSFTKVFKLTEAQFVNKNISILNEIESIELFGLENEFIQVLINILNNAKDELIKHENLKRMVKINTRCENEMVIISILDNAGGIEEQIINKIFEPYFTTKINAGGTGIGLSMSKSIIEKHMDGKLEVINSEFTFENETYKGANFRIFLPIGKK